MVSCISSQIIIIPSSAASLRSHHSISFSNQRGCVILRAVNVVSLMTAASAWLVDPISSCQRTSNALVSGDAGCFLEFNSLRPRQNGRYFPDDIFKCIFLNENVRISIKISLKFVPKGPINNIPALVQIMAWRRPGDKPLSEPMVVRLLTHICVTRPQLVNADNDWKW